MTYAQFGDLAGRAGDGILVAFPAGLRVVDRAQAIVDILHFVKSGLIRLMGGIFDQAVGLVIETGGRF